jgi:cytoskeleton protein RodZ
VTEDKARPWGNWLRERREELGISLEQVEEETRIRVRYLEALESGEFEALPDPFVGRGFLRNYAAYLGLDPQEASDRYSKIVAPPAPESLAVEGPTPFSIDPFRPVDLHEMPGLRGPRLWAVALAVILIAALAVLAWWSYPRLQPWLVRDEPMATQTRAATSTEGADVKLATATHTPTRAPATTEAPATIEVPPDLTPTLEPTLTPTFTPSPTPTPSPVIYTGIFLELVFTDTSWIQVSVDGVRQFQGELETDTYKSWYGEERIELRIGNAGAVQVTVNGQNMGALGAVGEVVDRVFEKVGGEVSGHTPTPQITGTLTVEPTATPAGTALPEPATPTPEPATETPPEPTAAVAPTEEVTPSATP